MRPYVLASMLVLFTGSLSGFAWAGMNEMTPMAPATAQPGATMPGMSGGAAPAAAPMAGGCCMGMMGMDGKMGMGMGSAMPAPAPAAPMTGGAMPQSAMPGAPGTSSLYHIGSTGFFLDHPQHIALTIPQQAALNQAKEKALVAKISADRAVAQAEQELWTLTSVDRPDAAKIKVKVAEIGKLTGAERIAFITAVGDASKLLTDEQRRSLTGLAPPAPAMTAPAAPMPPM